MNEPLLQVLAQLVTPVVALASGLVATYVTLKNRALLAEVRKELAELENRIITRINGTYVRTAECQLRDQLIHERLTILQDAQSRKAAGD